jgi:hypothetical protein
MIMDCFTLRVRNDGVLALFVRHCERNEVERSNPESK